MYGILVLLFASQAFAYIVNGSMGREPNSNRGQCLSAKALSVEEAANILKRGRIHVSENVSDGELIAVATGIQQIESLSGGLFIGSSGARFEFTDDDGVWHQATEGIMVNREWSTETGMNSRNVGMLVHELGHYVGNNLSSSNPATYEA